MIDSVETNSCYKLYVYNIYKAIPPGFDSGDAQSYFCQTIPIEDKRVTPLPEKFVKGISMESLNKSSKVLSGGFIAQHHR